MSIGSLTALGVERLMRPPTGTAFSWPTLYLAVLEELTDSEYEALYVGTFPPWGSEASGGGYIRMPVPSWTTPNVQVQEDGGRTLYNLTAVTWPTATADWSGGANMEHIVVTDSVTPGQGDVYWFYNMAPIAPVLNGQTLEAAQNQLRFIF